MKLILPFLGLLAVALAWSSSRDSPRQGSWKNSLEVAREFKSGHTYKFRYDTQVSTGLGATNDLTSNLQRASHRLSSWIILNFENERTASLQLQEVRVASLNGELPELRRVQPMQIFEDQQIDSEMLEQLQMPCKFEIVDGLVERIYFDTKDSAWSKNIKRAVLNMIQLNLKQRSSDIEGFKNEQQYDERISSSSTSNNMFTLPELTLEGACQTVYTMTKVADEDDREVYNVTKSIDFKQCKDDSKTYALPLTYYGPRPQKPSVTSKLQDIEEQQLDRSTVLRYQIIGTPEKYAIGNVELLSQYVYKNFAAESIQSMETVVASRLVIDSIEKQSERESLSFSRSDSKEETILYSTEWDLDEKRFFQYGDEEFSTDSYPFALVPNKVHSILGLLRTLTQAVEEKTHGIESEITLKLQQIVELVRMCREHELKEVITKMESKKTQLDLFYDIMAMAGTQNTMKLLVHKIMKNEITTAKATVILRHWSKNIPAVSDRQIETVLSLCKHQKEESAPLRQSCWLTVGSMIGEACKESIRENEICPRGRKDKFAKALWEEFKSADNLYEKILALKAIGNAGLHSSLIHLEKLITDRREPSIVRIQAIDALRRLRSEIPRKVQRVLLPVFKNSLEVPEVRMTAFSMIMHTIPDKAVLDQITYVLHSDRSTHVRSFVVSCLKAYAASPIEVEREMARHLRAALSMAKVDLDVECRYTRVPIYSAEKQEGLFLNWASIFSTTDALPKHSSVSLDAFINGLFEKDYLSVSLTQSNIESLYHRIMESFFGSERQRSIRGRRSSRNNGEEELDSIFGDLKIQTREAYEKSPFGILSLRLRDVDHVILPLSEEHMPAILKPLLSGERPSLRDLDSDFFNGKNFRLTTAMSLHERSMKVATSSGMPLRILNTVPMLATINGELKLKLNSDNAKITLKAQPLISGVHARKMELWCPIINTGVETVRSIELNLPIDVEAIVMKPDSNDDEMIKITYRVPEEKTRLVGLHSLPVTFTRVWDSKTKMHGNTQVRTLHNLVMEQRLAEVRPREDSSIQISGHYHKPTEMSYSAFIRMIMTSENHIQMDFERQPGCPTEIEMALSGKFFEVVRGNSAKPNFEQFYQSNKKFQSVYDDEDMEELENNSERSTRLSNYLSNDYKPRSAYRHYIKAELKTTGGRTSYKASTQLEAICDSQMTYCKLMAKARRPPMLEGERKEWTLDAESQILFPEYVREVSDLNEKTNRHNKLATTLNVRWGAEETQRLNLKIQGERAVPQKWIQRSGAEWRRVLATAFINKYDLVADYQLSQEFKSQVEYYSSLLRWWYYWNVDSTESIEGRSNEVYATLIIDPRSRRHFNVSVKTPTDRVRLTNVQLPWSVKPFTLVRPQEERFEVNSFEDMMTNYHDSRRAECRVDGRKVKTFDSVTYKSPIGKCYTVIAKDCAKKSFAVLMKTIDEDTQAKNIKIVTQERTIEVELKDAKLIVKVDNEKITNVERLLEDYNIDYTEDFVRCTLPQGVSVRFDGKQATVKLSNYYKNAQCGLCGHFDGEEDDEFRMNDNSLTSDLKEYHRSFTMDDEKCKNIYEKEDLFGLESTSTRRQQARADFENDWENNDEDVEDYEMFDRRSSDKKNDDEDGEPIKRTKIVEYTHKICFSLKPVSECPRGYEPEKTESMKVPFTCLDRSSPEARRLLRQARNNDITSKLHGYKNSFVENVRTVSVCA